MEAKARITADDLALWREHPVTRWVVEALEVHAAAQRAEWEAISWAAGSADEKALIELRTRADAYRSIVETDYPQWCGVLGETPVE